MIQAVVICDGAEPCPEGFLPHHVPYRPQASTNLNGKTSPYKTTHKNHPCAIWVRESLDNYIWLIEMTKYLNEEYKTRYNKDSNHRSYDIIQSLPFPDFLESKGITKMALAMPDECVIVDDIVSSYRNYYIKEKQKLATWKNFETYPDWFIKNI